MFRESRAFELYCDAVRARLILLNLRPDSFTRDELIAAFRKGIDADSAANNFADYGAESYGDN